MPHFAWVAERPDVPPQWDLRRAGWRLAPGRSDEVAVHLVDGRASGVDGLPGKHATPAPLARCLFLGVEPGERRARLLEAGAGDALGGGVELRELALRAGRVAAVGEALPRRREVGPLTLDLLHRDARAGRRWLALHPREFGLLWRLADCPGEPVSRSRLLRDVWRLDFEPGSNSVEVHVSRLRAKLAAAGVEGLVETDPRGGYRLARPCGELVDQRLCA